ncbi:MAG: universal stress protein [Gammaproteobacteria bacterium]|nr:universal stress protein [Gammaproteobacteria bacterium]MBU1556661.1 universal stress protein [Gammaproteobacteria bacterium]MBU2072592.1 universal stress protein [Gammaproteobacteria bacterium]MBU2184122.1 universal stress protein [Gammaproteobacteria bacterium]MBU2206792.1 universal stress protein [Gammaproteobacteria bacterium]
MSRKVLACIDASPYAQAVCDYAAWAAKKLDVAMSVIHVLDKSAKVTTSDLSGSIGLGSQEALLAQLAELDEKHGKLTMESGRIILDAAKAHAEAAGVKAVDQRLRHGQLVETLAELEDETRLLVLGKRGLSSADAHGHMGTHVEQVIRTLHKPIMVTQQTYTEPKSIMLAFDGSATALKGLEMLAASPLGKGLPVHLVMAGANTAATEAHMDAAAGILRNAGFTTTIAIVGGEPEDVLHQYQQQHNIDLLVMGAYGHSRIRQFIVGSTTTAMISKAKCDLLILR